MPTKQNPGAFDCYKAALPDEPMFVILGRDPAGPATLDKWASERIRLGKNVTADDRDRIKAAVDEAGEMQEWRDRMVEASVNGVPPWRLPLGFDPMDSGAICIDEGADHPHARRYLSKALRSDIADLYSLVADDFGSANAGSKAGETKESLMRLSTRLRGYVDVLEESPGKIDAERDMELERIASGIGNFVEDSREVISRYTPQNRELWTRRLGGLTRAQEAILRLVDGENPVESNTFSDMVGIPEPVRSIPTIHRFDSATGRPVTEPVSVETNTHNHEEGGFVVTHFDADARQASYTSYREFRGPEGETVRVPVSPEKEMEALTAQKDAGLLSPAEAAMARSVLIADLQPVIDDAPDDLAHSPEVPPHRFAMFQKGTHYAYARGLEISPAHLAVALDEMHKDGWELVSVFGQTDSKHVGFIFKRTPSFTLSAPRPDTEGMTALRKHLDALRACERPPATVEPISEIVEAQIEGKPLDPRGRAQEP